MSLQLENQRQIVKEQIFKRIYSSLVDLAIVFSGSKTLKEITLKFLTPVVERSVYLYRYDDGSNILGTTNQYP